MLDVPASNIEVFFWRDTCVTSTTLDRPIWNKENQSAH
jgi:hypothetical protein